LAQRYRKQVQPVFGPVKAFGQALREFRKDRRISQEELAFDSGGFDRTYVSMVERGVRSPTIRSLVKLAEVLQVPASKIVARMETLVKNDRSQRRNSD